MARKHFALSAIAIFLALYLAGLARVSGHPEFVARIPNGANVPGVKALGHIDPNGGGARNDFGEAFEAAELAWTAELCQADSDGDGQTNGQELGDPCCEFNLASNAVVRWSKGVSHPGDSSSKSDPTLWANVNCTGSTTAAVGDSSHVDSSEEVGHSSSSSKDVAGKADSHEVSGGSATGSSGAANHRQHGVIAGVATIAAIVAALW